MSVIYEVNLKIQKRIEKEFQSWLVGHIQDVLAIDGFESATWFKVSDPIDEKGMLHWTMHYFLRDRPALDSYLEKHAPRLRQPAKEKFGDQFEASRRTLETVQEY